MDRLINAIGSKRGQALVETALILPLLLLVLMGIVEFGRIMNSYLIITNASREGARYAAVHSTDSQINSAITNLTSTLDQSQISSNITPSIDQRISGNPVTVTINYSVVLITPFLSSIVPNPFKITAQTTMRIE